MRLQCHRHCSRFVFRGGYGCFAPPFFAIHDATPITTAPVTIQNTALAILSNHERGLSTSLVSVLTTS